jgi:hypothetical protein
MRFVSDYSLWWLFPIALVALSFTAFLYRNQGWFGELSSPKKWSLRGLRFLSLFLLGILLLGMVFQAIHYREEKPILITLVDNSESMQHFKDSATVSPLTNQLLQAVNQRFAEKFELVNLTVGSNVGKEQPNFKEASSYLEKGFEKIAVDYYNRNVGAVIFVSDGNFNQGANPVYSAERLPFTPIFSLAVGDTNTRKDQYIKNVFVNEVTFLNNEFPVEVDVEAYKMGKRQVKIHLLHKGQKIASQTVNYANGVNDFQQVNFAITAKEIGFQTYTVQIETVEGEYSIKNNVRTFYVEVLDSRNKVLLLANAPHPDIAAFKEVLTQNENIEVVNAFLPKWTRNFDGIDLVVWHEPGNQADMSILATIEQKKIPVFFVIGPNSNPLTINKMSLGLTLPQGNQMDDVQATINDVFNAFELSDKTKESVNYFPPLKSRFGGFRLSGSTEILLNQRLGTIKKDDPLLFFKEGKNGKSAYLYGEGVWRWRLNDFVRTGNHDQFQELFSKVFNYLMVKQQGAGLRVSFPKRYTIDEEVVVNASFYNASFEPITQPLIALKVKSENGKEYKSQFGVVGTAYKASLGKLRAGKYAWEASTTHNGKKYVKTGFFVVEDIQLERMDNAANHAVLKQLADISKGKFFPLSAYADALTAIESRDDITVVSYEEKLFNRLLDYKWLLFFTFLLLATEWFLRRFWGSY